jgi:hypothetical protein
MVVAAHGEFRGTADQVYLSSRIVYHTVPLVLARSVRAQILVQGAQNHVNAYLENGIGESRDRNVEAARNWRIFWFCSENLHISSWHAYCYSPNRRTV